MSPGARAWAAAPLALAVLLAGCTSGDGGADVLQEAKDAIASGDLVLYLNVTAGNETYRYSSANLTEAGPPQPPQDVPRNVTVTLEATGLPESEDVAWSLDWDDKAATNGTAGGPSPGGNASADADEGREGRAASLRPGSIQGFGSDLPATFSHEFASDGPHEVTFALAIVEEQVQAVQAALQVGAGGSMPAIEPGTVLGSQPFNATGELPFGVPTGGSCSPEGSEEFPWSFNATYADYPAEVQQVLLQLDAAATGARSSIAFVDANGTVLAEEQGNGGEATLNATGPFQAGDYVVRVTGCSVAEGGFRVDGEATYVASRAQQP